MLILDQGTTISHLSWYTDSLKLKEKYMQRVKKEEYLIFVGLQVPAPSPFLLYAKCCPAQLSTLMEVFSICAVQRGSHWPHVARVTRELNLSFHFNLNSRT